MTDAEHKNLAEALVAFQAEAPTLPQTGKNPAFGGSKYTKLSEAVPVLAPILAKHGLAWTAKPGRNDNGEMVLRYRLLHAPSLDHDDGELPLMVDKQNAQGLGSAITYARRQAMFAQLNLVGEEDDDGNSASPAKSSYGTPVKPKGATEAQRKKIHALAREKGVTKERLRELAGVESTNDLTAGTGGTASKLIDTLTRLPTPKPDVPSDVPAASPSEFEHPPVASDPAAPFPAEPDAPTG